MLTRENTRQIRVGGLALGGGAPVTVQSMCNTKTWDVEATVSQIGRLRAAGCDIVRIAVPDLRSAEAVAAIREKTDVPLVADIHFDYRIALAAIRAGASKIRINPGNIGAAWKVREVAEAALAAGVPLRIGVNGGSLSAALREKYGAPTPEALVESALGQAELLERCAFHDIVLSLKTSSVTDTIEAYRLAAAACSYPLHIGVTEAGDGYSGLIKNAIGIGALLADGIGDTLRVSMTADPVEEIRAGREILRMLGMDPRDGIEIVSCPPCGRTQIDLIGTAARFKEACAGIDTKGKHIKVAVMGCAVNGPGEARDADFGIAGGNGSAVFFRAGETVCGIKEDEIIDRLLAEVRAAIGEKAE